MTGPPYMIGPDNRVIRHGRFFYPRSVMRGLVPLRYLRFLAPYRWLSASCGGSDWADTLSQLYKMLLAQPL